MVSTSEFDDVKSRLAAIENRHKILDKKEDEQEAELAADLNAGQEWQRRQDEQR